MDILEKSWAQILVLLAAIGWVIGHFFERAAKRKEVKFTLFEERRANATGDFLNAYFEVKEYFRNVSNREMEDHSLTGLEMDNRWNPVRNSFVNSYYKLRLFVNDDDMVPFENVYEFTFELKQTLSEYYQNAGPLMGYEHNSKYQNEYWSHYYVYEKRCEDHILKICKNFQHLYGMG